MTKPHDYLVWDDESRHWIGAMTQDEARDFALSGYECYRLVRVGWGEKRSTWESIKTHAPTQGLRVQTVDTK